MQWSNEVKEDFSAEGIFRKEHNFIVFLDMHVISIVSVIIIIIAKLETNLRFNNVDCK